MEEAIHNLNAFLISTFIDPSQKAPVSSLEPLLTGLGNDPLWLARARVVQHVLQPGKTTSETKEETLNFYAQYSSSAETSIEAARAAAVFEEPDLLLEYITKAEQYLQFTPQVSGVEVKFTPHQTEPRTRVGCLVKSQSAPPQSSPNSSSRQIELVKVNTNEEKFDPPQFVNADQQQLSTSLLSNLEYLVLLLHASYTCLSNPASNTTVVNEQALPFIRRVTETTDFSSIAFGIQERALFDRSVLEMKDITELERGTLQLMKISKAVHQPPVSLESSLTYFHMLVPLPWETVDELAARRLVAMSDFANAIPFYQYLNKPLDVAICLTAGGDHAAALKILESPELNDNCNAMLLKGDLSSDRALWHRVWDKFREPKAKFRLAQAAVADKKLDEALLHLDDLLAVQSNNYEALKLAASSAMTLERWDSAATYLRRCLATNDDDTRSWSNLATALLQVNQPEAAHHAIKQAIRVNQNQEPDLPTYTNYVALSAQLSLYDDVLVGVNRLAGAVERGSQPYIAKISGVLPRLVAHYLKSNFTGTNPQQQLIALFTDKLPAAIAPNDPMLLRLTGKIQLWAARYHQGLASLDKAVDSLLAELQSGVPVQDPRAKARISLYTNELIASLEEHGDKQGRIEGSKAYPGWQTRKLALEKTLESF